MRNGLLFRLVISVLAYLNSIKNTACSAAYLINVCKNILMRPTAKPHQLPSSVAPTVPDLITGTLEEGIRLMKVLMPLSY